MTVALACQSRAAIRAAEAAATAGLLHDLGKVVLSEYVAAEYGEIMEPRAGAECLVFGCGAGGTDSRMRRSGHDRAQLEPAGHDRAAFAIITTRMLWARRTSWWTLHLADAIGLLTGVGCGEVDGLAYAVQPAVLERCARILECWSRSAWTWCWS